MNGVITNTRDWLRGGIEGWNRFWFTPVDPATLSLIRVLAGLMLLYTHLVWSLDLEAFFGPHSWESPAAVAKLYELPPDPPATDELRVPDPWGGRNFAWSWFYWTTTPTALWSVHIAALVVFALFAVGLWTRVTSILAYVAALAYVNRTPAALFGLDQINLLLAMYLMIGPSGASYSIDAWRKRRSRPSSSDGKQRPASNMEPFAEPSVAANLSIRLIQLHLCVIYFFAGLGKVTGESWALGFGIWGGLANLEYQSLDATWIAYWPYLGAFLSHLTVFWELFYAALIWPRWTRPLMLLIAIPLHLGIAIFMGMVTFGLIMLVANLSFVSPSLIRQLPLLNRATPPLHRA